MSGERASVRLQAINDALETREWMGEQLWHAFPEIMVLVETAERAGNQELPVLTVAGYVYPLRKALDNLASKLSGEGQQ